MRLCCCSFSPPPPCSEGGLQVIKDNNVVDKIKKTATK